jgi:phosphoglycerate kinase
MKTVTDIDISGKIVWVRVDFNVPLDKDRNVVDDGRILAVLPTLQHVLAQNARLVIASHLGRPKGKVVPEFSLSPVARRLGALLKKDVKMAPDCIGAEVRALVDRMGPGDVLLLENLRFHPEEEKNDENFGKALAAQCDVYVNDAFAVSHRVNASVVSITRYAPVSAAGLLLKKELDYIGKSMADPVRPLVAVVGGAKISSKLTVLENIMQHVDKILIGGAMANTFLKYNGCEVGKSMIEEDLVETAGRILKQAAERNIKFYIPVDAVVADRFEADAAHRRVPVQEIGRDWMVMDIGPATAALYGEALQDAGTAVWNGPMGVFEMAPFSEGTRAVAHAIAGLQGTSIVGGGDTGSAVHQAGVTEKITYISTGGGAFLCMLEGKPLPAVAALESAEPATGA